MIHLNVPTLMMLFTVNLWIMVTLRQVLSLGFVFRFFTFEILWRLTYKWQVFQKQTKVGLIYPRSMVLSIIINDFLPLNIWSFQTWKIRLKSYLGNLYHLSFYKIIVDLFVKERYYAIVILKIKRWMKYFENESKKIYYI